MPANRVMAVLAQLYPAAQGRSAAAARDEVYIIVPELRFCMEGRIIRVNSVGDLTTGRSGSQQCPNKGWFRSKRIILSHLEIYREQAKYKQKRVIGIGRNDFKEPVVRTDLHLVPPFCGVGHVEGHECICPCI